MGDFVKDFRGDGSRVTGWDKPRSPASTGRIYTEASPSGVYPEVYGCEFIEREDRGWAPPAVKGPTSLNFDRPKLALLKKARQAALDAGELIFTFEGAPMRVDYAKYLIEYLDSRLAK